MSVGGNFVPTPLQFGQAYDAEKVRRLAEDVVRLAQRVSSVAGSVTNIGGVPSTTGVTSGFVLTVLAGGGYGWSIPTISGTVPWSQITGIPTSFPPQPHVLATTAGLAADHTVSGLTPGQVLIATGTNNAGFGTLNYSQLGDVSTAGLQVGYSPVWNGSQWIMQNVSQSFSGLTPGTVYTAVSSTVASFLPLSASSITGTFQPAQLGLGTPQYGIDPTTDTLLTGNGWWTAVQDLDISWSQISDVPKQVSNLGRFSSAFDGLVPKTGVAVSRGYFLRDDGNWSPNTGTGGGTVTAITQGAGIACSPNPITGTGTVALASISNNNVLGNISGGSAAPVGLTGAQVTSLLSVFNTTTQGVVPASGGVANTFLREDGVFSTVTTTTPLTTKGDLLTWTTALARLPVGTDGQALFADSTQPTGLHWEAVSPLTTKGDIYTFGTSNARLGVGANGQALVADSTQTTGLRWSATTALFSGLAQYGKDPETDTVLTGNGWWTEVRGLDISWAQISNVPPQVSNLFQSLAKYDFGAPGYTGAPTLFLRQDGHWAPAGSNSPLTTKGDLYTFGTANARLPVGTDTYVLTADSTQTLGIKWAPGGSASTPVPATIPDLQWWWASDGFPVGTNRGIWALANKNPEYGGFFAQLGGGFNPDTGPVTDGSTLNSLAVVKWSGSSSGRIPLSLAIDPDQVTIFVVFKPNSTSGAVLLGAPQNGFEVDLGGGTGNFGITKSFVAGLAFSTATFNSGTWYQANLTWQTSNGNYAFRQSRTATNSGSAGAQTWAANTTGFGWNVQGATADLNCYVAEFVFFSRVLTGTEITAMENYLFAKWGV